MSVFSTGSLPLNTIIFRVFIAVVCVSLSAYIYFDNFTYFVFPLLLIGLGLILDDYSRLFYILFAILPFSIEYYFEGAGLGTDIPSEPVMVALSFLTIITLIKTNFSLKFQYVTHPVFILVGFHVFWIFITVINSQNHLISIKFLLAKIWYILPFFIFPLIMLKKTEDLEKSYNILYKFLFVSICIVMIRHAFQGFSFAASYEVVRPLFRNHVNYAAICVVCLPFVWAFYRIKKLHQLPAKGMVWIFMIFITGIYFSYTRAAILSMFIAVGAYYIIKKRWVKQALIISSVVAASGIIFLSLNNKYMDLTPDFERTITHTEFDNLLEATYKLEDISSMERVYRWMAGIEMIKERFWLGFGPGSFYPNYKSYSISRFQTYVSDNPDHSGIHNYFLMTWVEQGFIGFLILIALCFTLLIEGERLFHICTDAKDRYLIMAATLGLIIIFAMCLINDLLETDKVGPFFFFNTAILLFYSNKYKFVER
jgi:O-antigen ligase